MPRLEIVYFTGCPLMERARTAIRDAGLSKFSEINQDKLADDHELKRLSSPSILVDGKLFAGSRNSPATCSVMNWSSVTSELKALLKKG